jgi:hypothetical protein
MQEVVVVVQLPQQQQVEVALVVAGLVLLVAD